jgi:hypothetical protein
VSEVTLTITIKPKLIVKPRFTTLKLEVVFNELAISTLASRVRAVLSDLREALIEPLNERVAVLRTPSGVYYERWVKIAAKSPLDVRELWRNEENEFIVEDALYVM